MTSTLNCIAIVIIALGVIVFLCVSAAIALCRPFDLGDHDDDHPDHHH
jgi:hypothetical protein